MNSIFIEPGSLPGGRAWLDVCSNVKERVADQSASAASQSVAEALHCDVSALSGFFQVFLLLCVYGGILFKASQLIAQGSELLLLVPSLRNIVGSVVLPILGAVPDGAIVLFSGLGENAQTELSVGVGALAGSTSMLLTLPWMLSIIAGRVNIREDGMLTYHQRGRKLNPPGNWHPTRTGVEPLHVVKTTGKVMLLTSVSYLVIQGAALSTGVFFKADENAAVTKMAAEAERLPAMLCLAVCLSFFAWYLYSQLTASEEEQLNYNARVDEITQKHILSKDISLTAAFQEIWDAADDVDQVDEATGLILDQHKKERLVHIVKTFYNGYDINKDGNINKLELQYLMDDLGEKLSPNEIEEMYAAMDHSGNGEVDFEEFVSYMPKFIVGRAQQRRTQNEQNAQNAQPRVVGDTENAAEPNQEEEEEDEVPRDLVHADPKEQIRMIKKRAFTMMGVGTALVLFFSNPMVSVMSDVGERIGVPAFYVSFVLAPLASNASELFAAYAYALKKTRKTITISFSTLLGAAIMNNTFVLSIFMMLITIKGLAWQFTAETMSILFVEIVIAYMSQKKVLTLRDGYYIIAVYPMSIAMVFILENVFGLD